MTEAESFYVPDRGDFVGTRLSEGAWDPNAQTGVAVCALLGHVVEDIPSLVPMDLTRITVDLVRPLPIGRRVTVGSTIVREGKKLQVSDIVLRVDDVEHVRARVLRLRSADISGTAGLPESSTDADPASLLEPPEALPALAREDGPGMVRALDLRRAPALDGGSFGYWVRLKVAVVAGEPVRPTSRQTFATDFTSCIGADFRLDVATTINPDVSAHFVRPPAGEWVAITGETRFVHQRGRGISDATLSDRDGLFAVATAAVLVQPLG